LRLVYLVGVMLYALANLTASVMTAARAGWRHLPILMLAFAAMHVSYGLGFWGGIARFGPPWRRAEAQHG
jgi:hypothetical protein